jgi:hypothetical protein
LKIDTLDFTELCAILTAINSKDQNKKLIETIDDELKEITSRVKQYNGKGKLTVILEIVHDKDNRDKVILTAEVLTKYPKPKEPLELYQDDSGFLILEDPRQIRLIPDPKVEQLRKNLEDKKNA